MGLEALLSLRNRRPCARLSAQPAPRASSGLHSQDSATWAVRRLSQEAEGGSGTDPSGRLHHTPGLPGPQSICTKQRRAQVLWGHSQQERGASPGGISGRSWRRGSEGHGAESTPSKGTQWDRGVCGKAARLRVVGSSPSRGEPPQAGGDLGPRSLETSQVAFLPWLCLSFTPMARGDHPPLEPTGEPGGY